MSKCYERVYYDRYTGKMNFWYCENGKHYHDIIDHEIEYYVYDKNSNDAEDIFGNKVKKKTASYSASVRKVKESGVRVFNGDLMEEMKFLYKRYGNEKLTPNTKDINVCYLDIEIETEDGKGFPNPEDANFPINLITLKLSRNGKRYTFGSREYKGGLDNYWFIPDEKIMMQEFLQFFNKCKVSILSGWNIQNFDIPYIINRCRKLGLDYSLLSPVKKLRESEDKKLYEIHALNVLDYIELYKKFTFVKRDNYKLDNICEIELGEGKLHYEGSISAFCKNDWNRFVDYNIRDVELIERLENKKKLIEVAINISHKSLIPIDKVFSTVAIIEGLLFKELSNKNKVIEDKPKVVIKESLKGAYVESRVGYFKDIISFDVESLYPHIIMIYNVSPETLLHKCGLEDDLINPPIDGIYYKREQGVIPTIVEDMFNSRKRFKTKKKICEAIRQSNSDESICKEMGFTKEFYNELKKEIEQENGNADVYEVKQMVEKINVNAVYGAMANEYFHYYNIDNAKTITLGGQHIIKYLRDSINGLYNKKYGVAGEFQTIVDTDSCYIYFSEIRKKLGEDKIPFLDWAKKHNTEILTPYFKQVMDKYFSKYMTQNRINFKLEKIGNYMIISGDKHYAIEYLHNEGVDYAKPKLSVTGMESKKSSSNKFVRGKSNGGYGYFDQILWDFLRNVNKTDVLNSVLSKKEQFYNAPIDDIAFNVGIGDYDKYAVTGFNFMFKTPIQNQAAIAYNRLVEKYNLPYKTVYNKDKIKYIYVKENKNNIKVIGWMDSFPKEILQEYEIDYDTQFYKGFVRPIENNIFSPMEWGDVRLDYIGSMDIFE